MLPDADVAVLATAVNNFANYADAYLMNTTAPVPQGLAGTLSSADAISLLENTYNFIYLDDATNCLADTPVKTNIIITKNAAGTINIQDIAAAYNASFTTIKNAFTIFQHNDKKLDIVDVELVNETATTAEVSFTAIIKWNAVTPDVWMTTSTAPVFPTVPNTDYWHYANRGGKYGTTAYDGVMGSPEIIVQYVKAYLGFYSATSPVRFKVPVGAVNASTNPGFTTSHPPTYYFIDPTLPVGDPITPDSWRTCVGAGNCLWIGKLLDPSLWPYTSPGVLDNYLTGSAVNYHITKLPILLNRAIAATGKSVWSFSIAPVENLSMSNPATVFHYTDIVCADLADMQIIVTNVPYSHPPIARPMHN